MEKNLSIVALDGMAVLYLKTNLSNDCCGRCSCANFFYIKDFAKVPSLEIKVAYRHCGTGTFFQSTDGTSAGTKKVPRLIKVKFFKIYLSEGKSDPGKIIRSGR